MMSHFLARVGDFLHLHHADRPAATPAARDEVAATGRPTSTNDLSFFGLRADHHSLDPCRSLGQYALLRRDDEKCRHDDGCETLAP